MQPSVLLLLLLLALPATGQTITHFNRDTCLTRVQAGLQDGTISPNNATLFYCAKNGTLESTWDDPILSLQGCQILCGEAQGWYVDAGPRLNTWLIPVVLLMTNMEVSPLDKRRYFTIVHLIGDPVDSLWSMLSKLETWTRIYGLTQSELLDVVGITGGDFNIKIIATVLAGIEELLGPTVDPLGVFNGVIGPLSQKRLAMSVCRAAFRLADSRSDEIIRTSFAVVLYLYQILTAFITVLGGGNTSPPGGRIGTAMFITWLVPAILLSNTIGGFHSRTANFQIMADFEKEVRLQHPPLSSRPPSLLTERVLSHNEYLEAQCWNGSIYSYIQDKKPAFSGGRRDRRRRHLYLLSLAPVLNSAILGSVIIWCTTPKGFNCRNVMLIVVTGLWIVSTFLTWLISSRKWLSAEKAWHRVLFKDALIALPTLLIIFLSSAGVFNSCFCWSGIYSLGAQAHVPLNVAGFFIQNDNHLYPILVAICLGLQVVLFGYMVFGNRRGLAIMRWSENEKRRLFDRLYSSLPREMTEW